MKHPSTVYATNFRIYSTEREVLVEFFYEPPHPEGVEPEEAVPLVTIALSQHTADGLTMMLQQSLIRRKKNNI